MLDHPSHPPPTKHPRAWRAWGLAFAVLSVLGGCYGLVAYIATLAGAFPIGASTPPLAPGLLAQPVAIYMHATFSGVAMIICGVQMLPSFRAWASYQTHRRLGRLYAGCVCVGAPSALALSTKAVGGAASTAGFAILGLLWLGTTLGGVYAACTHKHRLHARLMVHSSALCFSAVTQRMFLPIAIAMGIRSKDFDSGFAPPYSVISWACWVPNILLVELYFTYFKGSRDPLTWPEKLPLKAPSGTSALPPPARSTVSAA